VLRRIFGSKREKVVGGWRRLNNKELQKFYALPYIIKVVKWMSGTCITWDRS